MNDKKETPRIYVWSTPVRPSHFWDRWMDEDGILHFGGRQAGKTAAKDDAAFQRFMQKVLHD